MPVDVLRGWNLRISCKKRFPEADHLSDVRYRDGGRNNLESHEIPHLVRLTKILESSLHGYCCK